MKKGLKTIVAGVVVAVVGVVVLLCALGASGWNYNRVGNWEEDTYATDAEITKLTIEVNAGQVVIKRGSSNTVFVKYQYNDKYKPEFKEKGDGVLSIETAKKRWYNFNAWFEDAPTIEIEINENCFPVIDLELNAGTVQLGDGNWGNLIDVELNAGAMAIGNVTVDELHLDVNAGALDAQKIQCQKATCQLSAGAFSIKELVCGSFDCDVSAGSAEVKKLDSASITLDVSAGSAALGLAGAQSDYNVRVDKSAGSCNVSSQTNPAATRLLAIDISAGSVNISFGK